jgi:HTH-type transcriptional regulator/antitoxin HipB
MILCADSDIVILSESDHNISMIEEHLGRNPKQIGNIIRNARRQRGWSQMLLAEKTGLRQETISLIETGNPATKLDTILSVLAALDLELRIALRSKGQPVAIEELF